MQLAHLTRMEVRPVKRFTPKVAVHLLVILLLVVLLALAMYTCVCMSFVCSPFGLSTFFIWIILVRALAQYTLLSHHIQKTNLHTPLKTWVLFEDADLDQICEYFQCITVTLTLDSYSVTAFELINKTDNC